MAPHCGHHRNRRSLRIMRTSTGEQRQAGHATATSSGLSNPGVPWLRKERPARPGVATKQVASHTHAVAWSATRPLASAHPLHGDRTEHLQCQRLDVQRLASEGNVETTGPQNRSVKSGERATSRRTRAQTDGGACGHDRRPRGGRGPSAAATASLGTLWISYSHSVQMRFTGKRQAHGREEGVINGRTTGPQRRP
jgi:hypothetical protein